MLLPQVDAPEGCDRTPASLCWSLLVFLVTLVRWCYWNFLVYLVSFV